MKSRRTRTDDGARQTADAPPTVNAQVAQCSEAFIAETRRLRDRYPSTAVALALLAVTAGTLRALQGQNTLSRKETREYLQQFTKYVLSSETNTTTRSPTKR
jgi:hypothetical protein